MKRSVLVSWRYRFIIPIYLFINAIALIFKNSITKIEMVPGIWYY